MKKAITEKSGIHKEWYEQARAMKPETIGEFIRHLIEDYEHDYGTICHAIAAAAVGAARAVDHSPSGGITGFQAGAIMWEFIRAWGAIDEGPKKIVCYANMLYPQYEEKFAKIISKDTWVWLQAEAKKNLEKESEFTHEHVKQHWEAINAGHIPFGYRLGE